MGVSGQRLAVLAVLLASLMVVLLGRAVQLQAGDAAQYARAVEGNRLRTLHEPAVRGLIIDQAGRPLAANQHVLQVVADRTVLYGLPGDGADIVTEVAGLLGTTFADLDARLTFCDSPSAVPGRCFDGTAGTPIPLAEDVSMEQALPILERPERYPGISVRTATIRSYPGAEGMRAGHLIGRLGAAGPDEVAAGYSPTDLVGRGGLEQQYDRALRGRDGSRTVLVDTTGRPSRTLQEEPAVNGATVVSTIDARLQAVVEEQLAAAVDRARASAPPDAPRPDSGSAVVVDVSNGRVLAMASYPDYAPGIWDGISEEEYRALADSGALPFRPVQGLYPPGSAYKPFTVVGMAAAGYPLEASYPCPSSYTAGGLAFANYESLGFGEITLQRAIEVSCNTVFYRAADELWAAAGGEGAGPGAPDPISAAGTGFGLGSATGIDLPGEAVGQVGGRAAKARQWEEQRDRWCAAAEAGYPQLRATDPDKADQFTALDRENCESGGVWRQGDALNASIGQGLTAVTPLQLAMAYAAIANGGTRYRAQAVKAVIGADGTVEAHDPQVLGTVAAQESTLRFLTGAMVGVTRSGTAAGAFRGFPLEQLPVAGKTGSAQVAGGEPATSWFASFAPADAPRYAVVVMVPGGGSGSGTSAPSVRAIYEAIFGVDAGAVDPQRSVLTSGEPLTGLPPLPGAPPSAEPDRDGPQ